MLKSMTGFGRSVMESAIGVQQWEIKSVNGRYLDFKWRLPAVAKPFELDFEKIARSYAERGRVEISLALRLDPAIAPKPVFNAYLANTMLDNLKALAVARAEDFTLDYGRLLSLPELWLEEDNPDNDDLANFLISGLEICLKDWNASQRKEGHALGLDLQARIIRMQEWTNLMIARAPEIRIEKLEQLRERLSLLLANSELDEGRFLQEVVILTDRHDATEELTRLETHLERLRELLEQGNDCGRRLDFTLQECFREINTCGNKLQDAQISRLVADFKNELEKCREQAMNLE